MQNVFMNPENGSKGVGIYLLGHGPYRSPRPIELQFMRINRYRELAGSKFYSWRSAPDQTFVDINYPRAEMRSDQTAFPSFSRLLHAAQAGEVDTVFFDVQEQVGFNHDYSWVSYLLKRYGIQPINVFYDPDNVLQKALDQRFEGRAYQSEITDASDVVAFYPTLSAEIALAALRSVHHRHLRNNVTPAEEVWGTLYRLRDQSPYASGREPFIQEDLIMEWHAQAEARLKEQWVERRKREQLFRLGPSLPGFLLDESAYGKLSGRSSEGLEWAEKRVLSDLLFDKILDGQHVSYVKNFLNYRIFADIRSKDRILFYVYKSGEKSTRREQSNVSFDLHDRYTKNLFERWQTELEKLVLARWGESAN
jgi:hypothetical protein